jgi:type II secretory pathway pseudopilin PulG
MTMQIGIDAGRAVGRIGRRRAFTTMEVMVALGLLSVAIVLLSQVALGQLAERRRQLTRQEVIEAAANILESARLMTPETLTPQWAAAQGLPDGLADRLLDGRLKVAAEPYGPQPAVKRVRVEISWLYDKNQPAGPVVLTGFYGARAAPRTEGKP